MLTCDLGTISSMKSVGMARRSDRPSAPLFRVALAFPHGVPFLERLLLGVARHARAAGWTFVRMPSSFDHFPLDWMKEWTGDGALVAAIQPRNLETLRRLDLPLVNLVVGSDDDGLPAVSIDHRAVGALAARHLRSRAFTSLAYFGTKNLHFSQLRKAGFVATLSEEGVTPQVLEVDAPSAKTWLMHQRRLERWLAALPPRTAIFACNDDHAMELLAACLRLELAVPERLAVLGVDDNPVLCEFAQPQLSSIRRDDERAGLLAATLLQRLMEARRRGLPAPVDRLHPTVPPLGVCERRSTAIYACRHPLVDEMVRRIVADSAQPFTIDDLTRDLPLARRRLECLFRDELGVSIYQFALRYRVDRARELIARSDGRSSLTTIAERCGFTSQRHLRLALRRMSITDVATVADTASR